MKLFSKMKRPGATVAGVFSLALTSVVLLCGAGAVPVENFAPQGPMQADLNAGGHNLTNVATVSATNVMVSGTLTAANLGSAATNAASAFAPASGSSNYDAAGAAAAAQAFAVQRANQTGTQSASTITGLAPGATNSAAYQSPITLTTSGTSGAATFASGTLNIPNYGGTSSGVTSFNTRTGAVTLQASDLAISGASLTALPANTALYPTLNQNTTGTATYATSAATVTSGGSGTFTGTFSGNGTALTSLNGYETQNFSGAVTSTLTVLGRTSEDNITMSAGSGAYTVNDVLSATGAQQGDVWEVVTAYPASLNPTIRFIDGASSGTLTTGSQTLASSGTTTLQFFFNGTNWIHAPKGALLTRTLGSGVQTALGNGTNSASGPVVADSNNLVPYNAWTQNLDGQAFIFTGDSITAGNHVTPTTVFGYLFCQQSWALNHGTYYLAATSGALAQTGQTGTNIGSQTITLSTSTNTITLASATGIYIGQLVTGTGIPSQTYITALSGTAATLSQTPTVSASESLSFFPGNIYDKFTTFVYPERPAANGGTGGPRSLVFVMCGTNDITAGTSAATLLTALTSYVTLCHANGFTVVLSTILPRNDASWSPAYEAIRESVNASILQGATAANLVLDPSSVLDMTSSTFTSDEIHPNTLGNQLLANYYNTAMMTAGGYVQPAGSLSSAPLIVQQGITFESTLGLPQPTLNFGATFGVAQTSGGVPLFVQSTASTGYGYLGFDSSSGLNEGYVGYANSGASHFPGEIYLGSNANGSQTVIGQNYTAVLTTDGSYNAEISSGNAIIETSGKGFAAYRTSLSASGIAQPGFTVLTGSTASQTVTLPSPTNPTTNSSLRIILKNQSSQTWTVSSNSGSQIITTGATTASASTTIASGAAQAYSSDGTSWNQTQ